MKMFKCQISAEKFDKAVHGGDGEVPVLSDGRDLAVYVKPDATVGHKPAAVITFTVRQTDGTLARAQAVTTLNLLESILSVIRGWKEGGHL